MREEALGGLPEPQPPQAGFVYFIRQGGNGPIKIGQARDVERRRTELQQACHEQLIILAKSRDYLELQLHHFYSDEWIRGEWFQPSPRLLAFIETLGG